MNREQEIRKSFNNDRNCWSRKTKNGTVEYCNKEYYNSKFESIEDNLLNEIEKELKRS